MSNNKAALPDMDIPVSYPLQNLINSGVNPSYYHVQNTYLQQYFRRYLFNKAVSIFKFDIPENWDRDYLAYCLFALGYVGVFNTAEYGVIPQAGSFYGYDLYYRPKNFICVNPYLKEHYYDLEIGRNCVLVKLTSDYLGILDLINYYADQLALSAETWGINLFTARVAYMAIASNKAAAESLKKAYDEMSGGNPFVVIDKDLMREDGSRPWEWFAQDLRSNFIGPDILADMRKIETMFDADIGLKNSNTDKKERLITAEVEANDDSTLSKSDVWLDNLRDGFSEVEQLFDVKITVKRRYNHETESAAVNPDTVSP